MVFGGWGGIEYCQIPGNSSFPETLLVSCSCDSHKYYCYFSDYSNTQRSDLPSQYLPLGKDDMSHITEY